MGTKYDGLIAIASVAIGGGIAWLTYSPAPKVEAPIPVKEVRVVELRQDTFNQRWTFQTPLPTIMVRTERVASAPEVIEEKPAAEPVRVRRTIRRDICARHNMRKVQIGKRWRCKR